MPEELTSTPTDAEIARAKRYLATISLHYHELSDGSVIISGLPTLFHTVYGANRDDAMAILVHNVVKVFASVGPIIEAEVHDRWRAAVGMPLEQAEENARSLK